MSGLLRSLRGAARSFGSFALVSILIAAWAASPRAQTAYLLWPNGAPGAKDNTDAAKPSVTAFLPDAQKSVGVAAVICPGGGYTSLATDLEGNQIAKWLNGLGVTAFVLKYRVSPYRHPIEMNDGQRAMRWVRANAKRFSIDPGRIGIVGFSAGGHLASTVTVHADDGDPKAADSVDRQSCRPYFQILGYPVITMMGPFVHTGSRDALLGLNPDTATLLYLSNEKHVTKQSAPTFLVHAKDDPVVLVDNSIMYDDSCTSAGVPVLMKLFDHGPHGFGLANGQAGAPNDAALATWPAICANWMTERGFLTQSVEIRPLRPRAGPGFAAPMYGEGFDFLGRHRRQAPSLLVAPPSTSR